MILSCVVENVTLMTPYWAEIALTNINNYRKVTVLIFYMTV